jgi:hypothetical protein
MLVWGMFAVQAEAIITNDSFELFSGNTSLMTVSYYSLMIPVLAKLVWQPSIFVLQGFAGGYLSLPLGQMEVRHSNGSYSENISLQFGFMAGAGFGIRAGPGTIMADIRYAMDSGNVTAQNGNRNICRRSKVFFALGYEIGLF